jgi:hypothetical protein
MCTPVQWRGQVLGLEHFWSTWDWRHSKCNHPSYSAFRPRCRCVCIHTHTRAHMHTYFLLDDQTPARPRSIPQATLMIIPPIIHSYLARPCDELPIPGFSFFRFLDFLMKNRFILEYELITQQLRESHDMCRGRGSVRLLSSVGTRVRPHPLPSRPTLSGWSGAANLVRRRVLLPRRDLQRDQMSTWLQMPLRCLWPTRMQVLQSRALPWQVI